MMKTQKHRVIVTFASKARAMRSKEKTQKQQKAKVLPLHKGKLIAVIAMAASMTACSGTALNGDQFRLSGTPEGIESFADLMIGTQTEAKGSPDVKSSYWQNRDNKLMIKLKKGGSNGN